jgi:NAD(P)-dependent dehydrogenase (short-subunit alcohol dehydrogenase family)
MKQVVITGVSRGLGRVLAHFFAEQGWAVAGCARNASALAKLQKALPVPPGHRAHDLGPVEIGQESEVAAWAQRLIREGWEPDLILNNAAIIARPAPLWEVPSAEIEQVLRINVLGTIQVIRHFLPVLLAKEQGVIVNFSSGWGRSTSPEVATYCTSKWAIEGLTSALAQELPQGIAAVALNPGVISTDMLKECWGDEALAYPSPEKWIQVAGPFLTKLSAKDNGRALTVPGME